MEVAISRGAKQYKLLCGSYVMKQVYVYGGLDLSPTEITRSFGMTWGIGGWLLFPFLQKISPEDVSKLRARVVSESEDRFCEPIFVTPDFSRPSAAIGCHLGLRQALHR